VKPPAEGRTEFTVRSPVVTASVRGTSFEFDTKSLRVDEGRVVYSLANGREASVPAGGMSYVDETNSTVINPFETAAELLTPTSPTGNDTGGPAGDNTPTIIPPIILPASETGVGVGFGWE
jgi:hypothetical protein